MQRTLASLIGKTFCVMIESADLMNRIERQGQYDIAWSLFTELRKELVETQKTRIQLVGFKITFVSAALAVIGSNLDKVPPAVLALPAFAAVFFDFLVNSYSFSVKRIGFYCRVYLEPILRKEVDLPLSCPLWEEYLTKPQTRQMLSFSGNLGLTLLASVVAVVGLTTPFRPWISSTSVAALCILLVYDVRGYAALWRFRKSSLDDKQSAPRDGA